MTDSDDLKELRERALASETNANELFEISAQHPEVYAEVAANPNAYPDLLDWLENVGDDRVKAVVAARRDGLAGTEALAKGSQEAAEAASGEKDSDPEGDQAEQEPGSADSSTLAFAPPTDPESETEATEQIETTDQAVETERADEVAAAAEGAAAETEELAESPVASAAAETAGESPEPPSESAQSPQIPGSDEENDDDATRLGSLPVANPGSSAQTAADYPTVMAAPAAMPPAYASPVYAEPAYPEPPRQPIMSPSPAAYSPFPAYQNPAGESSQPEKSGRSWGIIILTVLLVVALIGLAIVGTWIVSSRGDNKGQASASESQSDATRTATVMETTVTTTETPIETGKPIPAGAVYLERGFYTPTGNIACLMFSDEVYCQIYQRQWEQGCDDIWAMQLTAGGVDQHCDPGNGTDPQTQATYDTVYYNGDYACEVGKYTGVNCWNSKTGRGFTMRQADHSTY
ncbi:hypothetical protein [uncultured Varibaculum sp.]|uniref:variant leucine-rich repeat-containing protein n=1 Tax=uncultured Varibaculum sp. TaxID=413896 RepID=UPI0027D957AF|nr:hypothetical protein [uncultured Varibaculum sp.]